MTQFNIMHTEDGSSVVTFVGYDGVPRTVTDESPIYLDVVQDLIDGADPTDWFDDQADPIADERVTYRDGQFCFENEAVHENVGEVIIRYQREGRDTANLVRFMERLSKNPSHRSREQLFNWTQAKELVIDTDGFIIAYKGVTHELLSVHSGTAEVNGVTHDGQIPNLVGSVISMPREKVNDDPNQGCSYGLHVGNYGYASTFGQVLLEVKVDPADVVSVPADCSYQKMRTCRYEVIAIHESDDDDVSDTYEPESTIDPDEVDEAFDAFMEYVPESFLASLRNRVAARLGRKSKDAG